MPAQRDSKGKFVKSGAGADALADVTGLLNSLGTGAASVRSPLEDVTGLLASLGRNAANLPSAPTAPAPSSSPVPVPALPGGDPTAPANRGVDRLIGKRAALRDAVGGSMGSALGAAQQLGGPLQGIAVKAQNIAAFFGRVPPHVATILVTVAALTVGVVALGAAVHELAETAIDVVGKLSMMRSVLGALHSSSAVGANITNLVNALGSAIPFATDQIGEWAKGLSMVARTGRQLESMVRAVAAAQAIMGASGASAAQAMMETLGRGGAAAVSLVAKLRSGTPEAREELSRLGLKTIDLARALGMTEAQFRRSALTADQMSAAVQKALQAKGAGPLAEMWSSFPVILAKAKEGLLSVFEAAEPAVKPFMAKVRQLFGEFGRGGAAAAGLKPVLVGVLSTVFRWATMGVRAGHELIQGFMGTAKVKTTWSEIGEVVRRVTSIVVGIVGGVAKLASSKEFVTWLKVALVGLAIVVGLVAAAFIGIGVAIGIVITVIGAIGAAIVWVVSKIVDLAKAAWDLGAAIVDGLVGGIDPSAFMGKMAAMARQGLAAFKGIFGIASPSTVMLEHGEEDIGGAAATGVDRAAPKMRASLARLGDGAGKGRSAGKGSGASGEGTTITFTGCTFWGTSEEKIRQLFARVLEELAGEAGAAPEGAT